MSIKEVDIFPSLEFAKGYVAGFFDGEGSVGLYFHENYPRPVISITNCHRHVLNYISFLLLPILKIDVKCQRNLLEAIKDPENAVIQVRMQSWEGVKSFVDLFKDICIVKRKELELMGQAIRLHQELISEHKGRKVYSEANTEAFRRITNEMKMVKMRKTKKTRAKYEKSC